MEKNVGRTDRIARLTIGPILLIVGFAGFLGFLSLALGPISTVVMAVLAVVVGAIFTATGAMQTCPLYRIFGLSTCSVRPGGTAR